MTTSNCPRCDEPFRLPVEPDEAGGLLSGAFGECPWCRETFPMSEVTRGLPPMLKVTSASGEPIRARSGAAAMSAVAASSPGSHVDGDELGEFDFGGDPEATVTNETVSDETWNDSMALGSPVTEETLVVVEDEAELNDVDEFDAADLEDDEVSAETIDREFPGLGDNWGSAVSSETPTEPMRVSAPRRRPQKKGAPWKTAIGVVLGGAMALPIADGILVLAGRDSILGIWPSSGTPTASSNRASAPPQIPSDEQRGNRPKATGRTLSMPDVDEELPTLDESASQALDELAPTADDVASTDEAPSVEAPAIANDSKVAKPAMEMPNVEEPKVVTPSIETPSIELPTIPEPSVDESAVDERSTEDALAMPSEAPAAAETTPAESANVVTEIEPTPPAETKAEPTPRVAAVEEANKYLDAVMDMADEDPLRRKALAVAYREIAKVGVAEGDATDDQAAHDLLIRIKNAPSVLKIYESASTIWFTHPGRETDGILVIGKPGSSAKGPTITVGTDKQILISGGPDLPASDRVIALGQIVGDGSDSVIKLSVAEPL